MQLSDKLIQEMKDILEKEKGREFSWDEASEAANNLASLGKLLLELSLKEMERKKKLEEFPKGYLLEGGFSCGICMGGSHDKQIWYDKWGMNCMTCQKAVNKKIIPASVAKDRESWYSDYDIESCFNVKGPVLKTWIKDGILKARTIPREGKGNHMRLFLIKDNKDTLPPKKMVKSQMVKEIKDGQDYFHLEPWYRFVDATEYLKDYKIMNHLRVTYGEKDPKEK